MKVLVVDDEENVRYLVSTALEIEGYEVFTASTVEEAKSKIGISVADLIILDVMLPDVDGFTFLEYIRKSGLKVPVIFLTAQNSTEDRVRGLTIGGDDYLGKPFALAELVARVRLQLNKFSGSSQTYTLNCGDLVMNEDTRTVTKNGKTKDLTRTEYELLRYLLMNKGVVLSREKILDHVWDYDFQGTSTVLDTFMSNLRKKVDGSNPRLIHTVRGIGYSMKEPR